MVDDRRVAENSNADCVIDIGGSLRSNPSQSGAVRSTGIITYPVTSLAFFPSLELLAIISLSYNTINQSIFNPHTNRKNG